MEPFLSLSFSLSLSLSLLPLLSLFLSPFPMRRASAVHLVISPQFYARRAGSPLSLFRSRLLQRVGNMQKSSPDDGFECQRVVLLLRGESCFLSLSLWRGHVSSLCVCVCITSLMFVSSLSLQGAIVSLTRHKSELFTLNLGVHQLLAKAEASKKRRRTKDGEELAQTDGKKKTQTEDNFQKLRDSVLELYADWDEAFHR